MNTIDTLITGKNPSCSVMTDRYVGFKEDNNVLKNIEPYKIHNNVGKKIEVYKDNILIDSFYTISEASKTMKRSRTAISKYIAGTTIDRSGYVWKNLANPIINNIENPINRKTIFYYDKDNNLIDSFYSVFNASNLLSINRQAINRYIKNGIDENGNTWIKKF